MKRNLMKNVNKDFGRKEFEIFNYKNLGQVRTFLDENKNPWFCLNDICTILEISNITNLKERLREDGLGLTEVIDNLGRLQNMYFVDEGNLYRAIGRSRKPEAVPFMNWIYDEVIPSIRKHGFYVNKEHNFTDEDLDRWAISTKAILKIYEDNKRLNSFINENGPMMSKMKDFFELGDYEAISKLTREFSFDDKGEENLKNFFKENQITNEENHPLAPYAGMGLFTRREIDHRKEEDGRIWFRFKLFITNKGIDYFTEVLEKEGYRKENIKLDGYQKGIITGWVTRIK